MSEIFMSYDLGRPGGDETAVMLYKKVNGEIEVLDYFYGEKAKSYIRNMGQPHPTGEM